MKPIFTLAVLLCAQLFYAQGEYLEKLPDNPDPGKCYAKCIVPDEFDIETLRIVEVPAHKKLVVSPAKYKVVQDEVVIKPASKNYTFIPATFTTIVDTF